MPTILHNDNEITAVEMLEKFDVVLTDIDIPFESMVFFLLKLTFAAIPAGLLLSILFGLFYVILLA